MIEASSLVGKTIAGRYWISELIGSGGMAWVFRATSGPYQVALKILNPNIGGDPDTARRFRHEAKAAARIEHPNAIRILDYGIDGEYAYIAMELLDGRELSEILAKEAPLDVWRSVDLVIQICDVLSAAHQVGILHRDLKPDNVIVIGQPPAEHIKVIDFGLAKVFGRKPGGDEVSSDMKLQWVVGTPEYMSPEQCRSGKLDQRSDIYAVGVLLYEMVTGKPPFDADSALDMMVKHVKDPPTRPSMRVPRLPPDLERVILKAITKEPSARYQTARHLQEALLKISFEAGHPSSSRPPIPELIIPQMPPVPRQSMPSIVDDEVLASIRAKIALPTPIAPNPYAPQPPSDPPRAQEISRPAIAPPAMTPSPQKKVRGPSEPKQDALPAAAAPASAEAPQRALLAPATLASSSQQSGSVKSPAPASAIQRPAGARSSTDSTRGEANANKARRRVLVIAVAIAVVAAAATAVAQWMHS
jgi:eukaryotic-like serine/threonine-protein kinase